LLAKEFLQSEFLKEFLLLDMEKDRMGAYPKPDDERWEDKYRYAYARDTVYSDLMTKIQSWAKESESIEKEEIEITKTIV
jgi:hypothetical protein